MMSRCKPRALGLAALLGSLALPAQAIVGATPTNAFFAVGQGVQVAPDWVLTVFHNAINPGNPYSNSYGTRSVAARYDAPGSGTFPANDFSLLRLLPSATTTAAPYLALNGTAVPEGNFAPLDVTLVSAANTAPARGYAYNAVSQSLLTFDPDDSGPLPPVTVNWLVSLDPVNHVQVGDSGGALFAGHVTDSSTLWGITSALLTDAQDHPTGSAFVQPAAYRSWIDATMAADTADAEMLLWTSAAVPEVQAWALWAAGLMLLARRATRKAE